MNQLPAIMVRAATVVAAASAAATLAQTPCGATHYGTGTAGSGSVVPTIAATDLPLIGNANFALRGSALLGGSWTIRLLGLARANTSVLGIDLLVNAPDLLASIATGAGNGSGQSTFALPIPPTPTLAGLALYSQLVTLDAGAASGFAASDGLTFTLRQNNLLGATSAYQGGAGSDAFSAIHYLGNGRILAGKRSSQANNRFLRSLDYGATWQVIGCPGSTGSHTYFFGQNGQTVLSGTGDNGNACLMRSTDSGASWTVALTFSDLQQLTGSNSPRAVFSPVHTGSGNWLVNIKCLDSINSILASTDDGQTWQLPAAQPGSGTSAWARQMIQTGDGVLLWPETLSNKMFRSDDRGASWTPATVPGAALFQPLCDAGSGIYIAGDATASANTEIRLHRSVDRGLTWTTVASVNLQLPGTTYWRDVIRAGDALYASACCLEGTTNQRFMQLFRSVDDGASWCSLGNPFIGPYGGMQATYQMCVTELHEVFAACQPDSTIIRWQVPPGGQ